ncbi:Retrovirus-related Pol polyprotein from transposon TNT 1-94 [Vitis vinifera]|uniref:Retrovirus-related Pol polyprotein from transposon TNT 1-94 n=1 Tax=Vitis vinifera TaxID=29760 RepID=A0A438JSU8_VITVI|nr:Retrovirus-related Pol polyprotein from transposon TNT 1-94 [Vitis vinifera]
MPLRRSIRERRNAISDDYIVYLQEREVESGMMEDDPINFQQAVKSSNSHKWIKAMNEEYKSMQDNKVWELVPLPVGTKPIGCKWIFKTKRDSNGNVERYKARLVAKGFTQKEGIDFKETFSPVSTKDSFRIIMALVAHYDLELHQMDVKTAFLNGDIDETIYMDCHKGPILIKSSKGMACKIANQVIPLSLKETNSVLINALKNSLESQEMQKIPYASAVGSLMYAQVCTRPDIAYIVGMLGRYLSNPGMDHWRAAKRVMRYLQRTKEYMLTYRRLDQLELIGYSDSDFAGCQDSRRSTSGYIYLLAGGAISWRSAKQTLVTSSTMEAEFVVCYEASNQGIWLRNFVTGLRVLDGIERPLKIFCDNKSAVLYSNNNRSSTKSKYIDIKFLVVKEKVQSGQISIEHIGTNSMIADPLTKGLPPKVFHEHTAHMGVVSFEDIQI